MAKIKVVGDALVVTSEMKMEDIALLEVRSPQLLVMKKENEDGCFEEVYRISVGIKAGLGKWGATFTGETRDGSGQATMTLNLPAGIKQVKEYVAETYGESLHKLYAAEEDISKHLEAFKALDKEIMDKVVVEDGGEVEQDEAQ